MNQSKSEKWLWQLKEAAYASLDRSANEKAAALSIHPDYKDESAFGLATFKIFQNPYPGRRNGAGLGIGSTGT